MPELPEVETTVQGLKKAVVGLTIADVWTDYTSEHKMHAESVKNPAYFKNFRKQIVGKKVISVERRAKNILINLSNGHTILVHMKMTGHLLYGKYTCDKKSNSWAPASNEKNAALRDPFNKFLHIVFSFTNGKQLVLSDLRKFAKITLLETKNMHGTVHLAGIGPEPLEKSFTLMKFKERLALRPTSKIKEVLMDPRAIAGIGNIYSDEMLWLAGIHPLSRVSKIPGPLLAKLYTAMLAVLKKGIDFGGDSTSDYRQLDGKPGKFSHEHNAYRLTGKPCKKKGCQGAILRIALGGRGAHFCSIHQKLFN